MEENGRMLESIPLENGLTLSFYDHSRVLPGGRRQVQLRIVIPLELKEEYFRECPDPKKAYETFSNACAGRLDFRQDKIRNFVDANQVEETLREMKEEFLRYGRDYVNRPNFAEKFVTKRYYEWQNERFVQEAHTEAIYKAQRD